MRTVPKASQAEIRTRAPEHSNLRILRTARPGPALSRALSGNGENDSQNGFLLVAAWSKTRGILYVHIPFTYSESFFITPSEQLYIRSTWAIHIVTRMGEFWRYDQLEITARVE